MPLEHKVSLTPINSYWHPGPGSYAFMIVWGAYNYPKTSFNSLTTFDNQHAENQLYFKDAAVGDATADYTNFLVRYRAPCVQLNYDLSAFEPYKEVALTVGFNAVKKSRVLIYTGNEFLGEEILHVGDNQFLIEVESTDSLSLFLIHANLDGSNIGGNWFFRGIDVYIA